MLPRELTRLVIIAIVKGDFQCLECSAKFNVLAILTLARVSALLCEEIIQVLQPAVLLKKQFRESKAPAKSVSRANHDKNMCKHPHYGQASSFEAVTDVYNFLKKFQVRSMPWISAIS